MPRSLGKADGFFGQLKKIIGGLGFRLSDAQVAAVGGELAKELQRAPRIALLGETGAGKSTTLNALFNAGAKIDHFRPCTQEPTEFAVVTELDGSHGPIRVFDMPGLGQDVTADAGFVKEYARILPTCDVALWIVDATARPLTQAITTLRGVVAESMTGLERLVVALNKVDRVEPGTWNVRTNCPSREQAGSIAARVADVKERLAANLPWKTPRIVAYSAKRHYCLPELQKAMMDACPLERRWVLHDRQELASYEELVDPAALAEVRKRVDAKAKTTRAKK